MSNGTSLYEINKLNIKIEFVIAHWKRCPWLEYQSKLGKEQLNKNKYFIINNNTIREINCYWTPFIDSSVFSQSP